MTFISLKSKNLHLAAIEIGFYLYNSFSVKLVYFCIPFCFAPFGLGVQLPIGC